MKTFFAFIGLSNVQFIYAEGLNMGDDAQKKAYDHAKKSISAITA